VAGEDGKGFLGVSFSVKGTLSEPEVNVNPLSAVVPKAFKTFLNDRTVRIELLPETQGV